MLSSSHPGWQACFKVCVLCFVNACRIIRSYGIFGAFLLWTPQSKGKTPTGKNGRICRKTWGLTTCISLGGGPWVVRVATSKANFGIIQAFSCTVCNFSHTFHRFFCQGPLLYKLAKPLLILVRVFSRCFCRCSIWTESSDRLVNWNLICSIYEVTGTFFPSSELHNKIPEMSQVSVYPSTSFRNRGHQE